MSEPILLSQRQFKLIKEMIKQRVFADSLILYPETPDAEIHEDLDVSLSLERILIKTLNRDSVPLSQNLSIEEFFDRYTFYDN